MHGMGPIRNRVHANIYLFGFIFVIIMGGVKGEFRSLTPPFLIRMGHIFRRRLFSVKSDQRSGQALVEFALMLPFLALLVVGSVDLGRAYFSYMSVINAAREGARYGAYHPTESANILSHARNEVDQNFINLTNLSVGQRCTDSSGNTASCAYLNAIEVTVSYPFRLFTTEAVGGTVITLSAKEAMEIYVK